MGESVQPPGLSYAPLHMCADVKGRSGQSEFGSSLTGLWRDNKLETHVERKLECTWNIGESGIANPAKDRIQQVLAYIAMLEIIKMQNLSAAARVCPIGPHT